MNSAHLTTYQDTTQPFSKRYDAALALADEAAAEGDYTASAYWKAAASELAAWAADHNGHLPGSAIHDPPMRPQHSNPLGMSPQEMAAAQQAGQRSQFNLLGRDPEDPDWIDDHDDLRDNYSGTVVERARAMEVGSGETLDWHTELNRKAATMFNQLHQQEE